MVNSLGGIATAKILRKAALDRYYAKPNLCKECGEIISVREGHKVKEARVKKFCNRSCANTFNNRGVKRYVRRTSKMEFVIICGKCKCEFTVPRTKSGGLPKCTICPDCKVHLSKRTKGQLKILRSRAQSHNIEIRRDARKIYERSGKPMSCVACGYRLHVEIAHIKEVWEFPDTATIKEINDINNLIAICCNCHWELDNKIITLGLRMNGAESLAV